MSRLRRIASKVAGGMFGVDPAPAQQAQRRLGICASCPSLRGYVCRDMKCGCDMREKAKWLTVRTMKNDRIRVVCPRSRWGE